MHSTVTSIGFMCQIFKIILIQITEADYMDPIGTGFHVAMTCLFVFLRLGLAAYQYTMANHYP